MGGRRSGPPDAVRIPVTATISLAEAELSESFVRASGPGGQNVNKLASAVQLRFDVRGSPPLPPGGGAPRARLAGPRARAPSRGAAPPPKPRRPTKPTKAARERRLEGKKRMARIKRLRRATPAGGEKRRSGFLVCAAGGRARR